MLKFAVGSEIVASGVCRSAQRTFEPAREVHVIVVPDVRHDFAAQFAPVQVASTWQFVKRKSHVPGF